MNETTLMLEIGSEALNELTSDEKSAILSAYSDSQVMLASMKVFKLLARKYQPNYRMGRMYENLGKKFEKYDQLYKEYTKFVRAGKLANTDFEGQKPIERDKFLQTHEDL